MVANHRFFFADDPRSDASDFAEARRTQEMNDISADLVLRPKF